MARISRIWAREILDSRAVPAVETVVQLDNGITAVASVPSGTSTGKYEAHELRDGDTKRFMGKGVLKAIENISQKLGPSIIGSDPTRQFEIDQRLIGVDGSPDKSALGANAILSVSLAVCRAGSMAANVSLHRWVWELAKAVGCVDANLPSKIPTPLFNMINGGLHGAGNLDFQEFQVIPASSKPYADSLRASVEVYYAIEGGLKRRGAIHSVGYEGGYAPNLFTNSDALAINVEAIGQAGYQIGQDFFLGLDVASQSFYKDEKYSIRDRSNPLTNTSMIAFFEEMVKEYRLIVLEDPLEPDDWDSWRQLTEKVGGSVLVVGDDLLTTNPSRVQTGIEKKACNSMIIKPNQIGTITETLQVVKLARAANWKIIVSHRSGETNDFFIADFAVGVKADFVKFGAPARGERVAKYNRLLSIEAELAAKPR